MSLIFSLLLSCNPTEQEQSEIDAALISQGCELPPSFEGYSCKGRFIVRNEADLEAYYQSDFGMKNGYARHLKIDSNFVAPKVQLFSPCSIVIRDNATVSATAEEGHLCMISKGRVVAKGMSLSFPSGNITLRSYESNVIMDDHTTITTKNLNMIADQGKAVIQNSAIIEAHDINMKSFGESEDARVHIRHSSNVTANNIFLEAKRKATLGRDSIYNVSGTISIKGEGPDDDSENPEFATIWRNTTVNTNELIIDSLSRTKVSRDITVNANRIVMNGPACRIGKNANLNAPVKEGNCFSGNHPTAHLRVPKAMRSGLVPHTVVFDASRSSDNEGIVRYEWKIGDIENITTTEPTLTYTFNEAGVYKVRLKVVDGNNLIDFRTRKITVTDEQGGGPSAYFAYIYEFPESLGEMALLELTNLSETEGSELTSASYSLPDGSNIELTNLNDKGQLEIDLDPIFTNFDITLNVTDGLGRSDSFTHSFNVNDLKPVVSFEVDQNGPLSVFVNLLESFDPVDSDLYLINIDFGDGNSITLDGEEPPFASHIYGQDGEYTITVTATNEVGSTVVAEDPILINSLPIAPMNPIANFEFDIEDDLSGLVSFFEERSAPFSGQELTNHWDFGDGTTLNDEVAPIHFFEPGSYLVTLTVTDGFGNTDSQTQLVVIEGGVDFNMLLDCADEGGQNVNCLVEAVDRQSQINKVTIDYGDGTIREHLSNGTQYVEIDENHQYAENGTYTISAVVETSRGDLVSETQTLMIQGGGNDFFIGLNCFTQGLEVFCDGFTDDPNAIVTNYNFSFGDGNSSNQTEANVSHTYSEANSYLVTLVATDDQGRQATASVEVTAEINNLAPVAEVNCISEIARNIECDASGSFDQDGFISNYEIDYNGEGIVSGTDPFTSFIFDEGGLKTISLTATDNQGAVNTIERSFFVLEEEVNQAPVASFFCISPGHLKLDCNGVNSSDPNGHALTFSWTTNTGLSATGENVSFDFSSGGNVDVELVVTDELGLNSTPVVQSFNITENIPPVAIFNESVNRNKVLLSSNSLDEDGDITLTQWLVDGGVVAEGPDVEITLNEFRTHTIELQVTDTDGAIASVSKEVTPEAPFINAIVVCNQTDNFIGSCDSSQSGIEYGEIESREWKVDGVVVSNADSITIERTQAETVQVELAIFAHSGAVTETTLREFILEEISLSELPSAASLEVLTDISNLVSTTSSIQVRVVDGVLNESSGFTTINNSLVSGNRVQFQGDLIELQGPFEDGVNEVVLQYLDDTGREFLNTFVFYAGSRQLEINLVGDAAPSDIKQVKMYSFDFSERVFEFSQNGSTLTFVNYPNVDMAIEISNGENSRVAIVRKDSSFPIGVDYSLRNLPINSANLDFQNDLDSWQLLDGNFEVIARTPTVINSNSGTSLKLTPSSSGKISIASIIETSDSVGKFIELPAIFNASSNDAYMVLRVRNQSSGESSVVARRFDESPLVGNVDEDIASLLVENEGDSFLVEAIAEYDDFTPTSLLEKMYRALTPEAYAQQVNVDQLQLEAVTLKGLGIRSLTILDGQGGGIGDRQETIISGPFAELYANRDGSKQAPNNRIYEVKARFDTTDLSSFSDRGLEAVLYVCNEEEDNVLGCSVSRPFDVVSNSNAIFDEFGSNSINVTSNWAKICMEIHTTVGEFEFARKCAISNSGDKNRKKGVFRVLLSGSGQGIFSGQDGKPVEDNSSLSIEEKAAFSRYGSRNNKAPKGMDDYYAISHDSLIKALSSTSYDFPISESDSNRIEYRLKIDDINSSGSNAIFGHTSHNYGTHVDFRWAIFSPIFGSSLFANSSLEVLGLEDGKALNSLLSNNELASKVDRILLTNQAFIDKKISEQELNEFASSDFEESDKPNYLARFAKTTCNSGSKIMLGHFLEFRGGHSNHLDIGFFDIDPRGSFEQSRDVSGFDFQGVVPSYEVGGSKITLSLQGDSLPSDFQGIVRYTLPEGDQALMPHSLQEDLPFFSPLNKAEIMVNKPLIGSMLKNAREGNLSANPKGFRVNEISLFNYFKQFTIHVTGLDRISGKCGTVQGLVSLIPLFSQEISGVEGLVIEEGKLRLNQFKNEQEDGSFVNSSAIPYVCDGLVEEFNCIDDALAGNFTEVATNFSIFSEHFENIQPGFLRLGQDSDEPREISGSLFGYSFENQEDAGKFEVNLGKSLSADNLILNAPTSVKMVGNRNDQEGSVSLSGSVISPLEGTEPFLYAFNGVVKASPNHSFTVAISGAVDETFTHTASFLVVDRFGNISQPAFATYEVVSCQGGECCISGEKFSTHQNQCLEDLGDPTFNGVCNGWFESGNPDIFICQVAFQCDLKNHGYGGSPDGGLCSTVGTVSAGREPDGSPPSEVRTFSRTVFYIDAFTGEQGELNASCTCN